MENCVDFMHLSDIIDLPHGCSNAISSYISLIKINGKPILPPLINDEKRLELNEDKRRAIELENKLAKNRDKKRTFNRTRHFSSQDASIAVVPPSRHLNPARPVSLSLIPYMPGKPVPTAEKYSVKDLATQKIEIPTNLGNISSQKSTKSTNKNFRSTLEQRLANEDELVIRNRKNNFKQSPIIEENYANIIDDLDSDNDSRKERKRWSPLKVDSLNSLKIQLPVKHSEQDNDIGEYEENLEISFEELQRSSDTLTPSSSSLMRQNSYTVLTPSPALLNYLETQREKENTQRSHSGRKTWDLSRAKQNWEPSTGKLTDPLDSGKISDGFEKGSPAKLDTSSLDSFPLAQKEQNRMSTPKDSVLSADPHRSFLSKHDSSSLESISITQKSQSFSGREGFFHNDGSTSPSSCSSKKPSPKIQKTKSKIKNKKSKSFKNVPSPTVTDKVPFNNGSNLTQSAHKACVPLGIGEELTDLSQMLLKIKFEHERQKKELEEKQRMELQEIELMFKSKEAELLQKVGSITRKGKRSIFSQFQNVQSGSDAELRMIGDGSHIPISVHNSETSSQPLNFHFTDDYSRRPQSAKDFHPHFYQFDKHSNRRTRSMDFNQGYYAQDTDLDVSFQDDSLRTKELSHGNEEVESDTVSNISSRSSTMSSETRMETMPLLEVRPYSMPMSSEDLEKYQKAATVITAAARGFLTRRLLNTSHVQGLITTLRDAISCATQLHSASDLGDSDVDLMRRLGRQIEAAWEAVYGVFFTTSIPEKLQLIAADRERLRNLTSRSTETQKRISSATEKSLRRKRGAGSLMSKSQTSNGCKPRRSCLKMAASYPSPMSRQKL